MIARGAVLTLGPRHSWIVLVVALAVIAVLWQTGHDWLFRVVLGAWIVAASTVGVPSGLRRWLLGESNIP